MPELVSYLENIPELVSYRRVVSYLENMPELVSYPGVVSYLENMPELVSYPGLVSYLENIPELVSYLERGVLSYLGVDVVPDRETLHCGEMYSVVVACHN